MPHRRRNVLIAALAALLLVGCAGRQPPVAGKAGDTSAGEVATSESTPAEAGEAVEETVVEETGATAEETVVEEVVETVAEPAPAAVPYSAPDSSMAGPPGSGIDTGRPYVVIRFTESDVDYEPALAQAVREAVARKPGLAFDLVAVTPAAGSAEDLADNAARARVQAQDVMQSLAAMGIGRDRVSVGSWNGLPSDVNEIRLYIR